MGALERKGLVRWLSDYAVVTPLGLGYDTGLRHAILRWAVTDALDRYQQKLRMTPTGR